MQNYDIGIRSLEGNMEFQNFCKDNWKCYYVNYKNKNFGLKCGYYLLTDIYIYFHLTHYGKLFPKNSIHLDDFMRIEYKKILSEATSNENWNIANSKLQVLADHTYNW